jgi:DNA-binding XRE family transcriptional regulator
MARQPGHHAEQQRALGRYLAALREAAGLYQGDIARTVPCHRTTVAHAEAGSQLPDATFWGIADRVIGANGALIVRYDQLIQAKSAHLAQQQAERRARAQATVQQLTTGPSLRPDQASPMSRARDDQHWGLVAGAPGGSSEDMMRRELLRLLSMIGALVTAPSAGEQLDQLDRSPIASGRFDNVAVDDYAALNDWIGFYRLQVARTSRSSCTII